MRNCSKDEIVIKVFAMRDCQDVRKLQVAMQEYRFTYTNYFDGGG